MWLLGLVSYREVSKHAIGVSVEDYAPLAGLGFLAFLLLFCWFIDKTYDWPVRRFLLRAILYKEPRANNPLSLRSSQVSWETRRPRGLKKVILRPIEPYEHIRANSRH